MEKQSKRQQRTVGSVVRILLGEGWHTYARILESRMAFYDVRSRDELAVSEILMKPVLFIASVCDEAVTQGHWPKASKAIPLEEKFLSINLPPVYRRDAINPDVYEIVYRDLSVRKARKEDVQTLEVWGVWGQEAIEQRLRDYFAGIKTQMETAFESFYDKQYL